MIRALLIALAFLSPIASLFLAYRGAHLAFALAPLFISHALLLYATLVPNCPWWGPIVTRFATTEKEVWLTIDDGPSHTHTIAILDLLEQFDARATFFVIGARAEEHPHLITEILMRGHALANHTQTHPRASFWAAGPARIRTEIARCAESLRSNAERPARYFRSPVGMTNPFVHPALARRGLTLIGWSVRGLDTVQRSAEAVARRIEERVVPGAIILLHEGQRVARQPEFNPRCVELTLQRLSARGYRFVIPEPAQLRARGG